MSSWVDLLKNIQKIWSEEDFLAMLTQMAMMPLKEQRNKGLLDQLDKILLKVHHWRMHT